MIERKTWLIVTFHTTTGAMAMEKYCKEQQIEGRLIPVPRAITADCGMAWKCSVETRSKITDRPDIAGIYEMQL